MIKPEVIKLIVDALKEYRDQNLSVNKVEVTNHIYEGECIKFTYREFSEDSTTDHVFIISVKEA